MSESVKEDRTTDSPPAPGAGRPFPPPPRTKGEESSSWVGLAVLVGLLALVGVRWGIAMVIVILALVVMIFMHELGHYLAARRGGMKVTEFFIGFGPRLWFFRRGETEYGFKGIPAGAYVRIIGMNNLDEVDPIDEERTYRQQSYPKRLLVAVAGSGMHFLMALGLLYALLVTNGIDVDEVAGDRDWVVDEILEDGPADRIGILPGDRVLAADGMEFATWTEMRLFVEANPGEAFDFTVQRGTEQLVLTGEIGVNDDDPSVGRIGIARSPAPFIKEGPVEAVPETFSQFGGAVKTTITTLGDFFTPSSLRNFFGLLDGSGAGDDDSAGEPAPGGNSGQTESTAGEEQRILSIVGATRIGAELTEQGVAGLLIFLFSINVFVGVFNLVPLLPLDGGHVVVATYERLRSRRGERYHADVAKLLPLTYAVVFTLVTIGLAAIYLDLSDPVSL